MHNIKVKCLARMAIAERCSKNNTLQISWEYIKLCCGAAAASRDPVRLVSVHIARYRMKINNY